MESIITTCSIHGDLDKTKCIKSGLDRNKKQRYRCKICQVSIRKKYNENSHDKRINCHRASRYKQYDLKIRWDTIKRKFGITKAEYEKLLLEQDEVCAICKKSERIHSRKGRGRTEYLCVDHCHATNKVRGLLCRACNAGLGNFKDSLDLLVRAINYIKIIP